MLLEDKIFAVDVPSLFGDTAAIILTGEFLWSLERFTQSGLVVIIEFLHWLINLL